MIPPPALPLVLSACLAGCTSFDVGWSPTDSGREANARSVVDALPAVDGPPQHDAVSESDAAADGRVDSGADGDVGPPHFTDASPREDSAVDTGLNPELVLPPADGGGCSPGSDSFCPFGETCRIASPHGGRCDVYTQGGSAGFLCVKDSDCDDMLQCFDGECQELCFGSSTCDGCSCADVGNNLIGLCCAGS